MTDDQTVESLRVMTNVRALLGAEGTTFANNFASFPLCCPSRSTFLTGQYAHNHTVMGNAPPTGGYEKLDHSNTLPVWLQRAGYRTVHIGKYLNGYGRRSATEIPPGWTEWYGSVDPSTYQFYNYTLNENGKTVKYGADPASYQADVYTRKAVDAVRRLAPGGPFFLNVAYLGAAQRRAARVRRPAPTSPRPCRRRGTATASPPSRCRSRRRSTRPTSATSPPGSAAGRLIGPERVGGDHRELPPAPRVAARVDEGVAELVAALRAAGELDNTLIVFTSDNGFFHGEHRVQTGKVLHYEPSTRVPLILRGPGIPRGVVRAPAGGEHRRRADDRVGGRRDAGPRDGRPPAAAVRRATGCSSPARDILLETPSYRALRSPRYVYVEHSQRRAGALRPRHRPERALEPARERGPRAAQGRARRSARKAARLRRGRVPPGRRRCRLRVRYNARPRAGTGLRARAAVVRPGRRRGRRRRLARRLLRRHPPDRAGSRGRRSRRPIPRRFLRSTTRVRALAFLKDSRLATLDWRVRACP